VKTTSNTVLLVVLAFALAGCGGGKSVETTAPATTAPTPTTSADPGKAIVDAFWVAARLGNAQALWALLSTSTKERLGPTLDDFRKGRVTELAKGLGAFTSFRPIVSERVTPEFGMVAIDGFRLVRESRTRAVFAVVLRLEGSRWKVELGGPVKVRPIGPDPNARETVVAQVAGAVEGPGGAGTAVMYVDGQTENPHVAGTATNSTLYANFEPALDPGRHTVVLFAVDGREASATAWAFSVER
jgi:hypothetical protein